MVLVAAVDQLLKMAVLAELEPGIPLPVCGQWFRLLLLFNSGAAFSMGTGMTWLFTVVQICFVVVIPWAVRRIPRPLEVIGFALVAGGALGNLLDRLFRAPAFFVGHVVDFISVGGFAVFNVADACITIGVFVLMLSAVMEYCRARREESQEVSPREESK